MQQEDKTRNSLKVIYFVVAAILVVVMLYSVANKPDSVQESIKEDVVLGGAFEVTDYLMDISVNSDHSYDVVETISVSIPKPVQNIKLSIPSGNFRTTGITVEDTAFFSTIGNDSSSITIVDPIKLTKQSQDFKISYNIREFEDRDGDKDVFYFNVVPAEWKQPIGNFEAHISFPEDFPWEDLQCYAGQFGVQDLNNRVTFDANEASKEVSIKGSRLPENYGVTVKADLPNHYWYGALNGSWALRSIIAIMGATLLVLALLWLIGGRDPKVIKTKENKPVEGIESCEIGYIFNSEVGIRDIVLLLMYFGRKGYLKISEYEPKRYRIYRGEDPVGEEKMYRNAYGILFEDIFKGRAIEMEDLGDRLMRIKDAIKDDIASGYSSPENVGITSRSQIFRYVSMGLLALALGICNALTYRFQYIDVNYVESALITLLFAGAVYMLVRARDRREGASDESNILAEIAAGAVLIGIIIYVTRAVLIRTTYVAAAAELAIMSVLALLFILIMRARGRNNAALVMKIRQVWDFIYHPTPKELLENYLEDNNYYYEMMEYALASGAEESWAISFLTLNVPEPAWFSNEVEGHAFSNIREDETTYDYARDFRIFMRTIENAFAEQQRREHRR